VAGLDLPCSAAAAAGLSVPQLKALLMVLGVAGLASAVERRVTLVELLVQHLQLN
jgi:hypothetical protein